MNNKSFKKTETGLLIPAERSIITDVRGEENFSIEVPSDDSNNVGYLTKSLIIATLPHKEPNKHEKITWSRHNGNFTLQINQHVVGKSDGTEERVGFPYGVIPRLLLIFVSTEVTRTRNRHIYLGRSLSEFLDRLGMTATGGKNGTITRVREQCKRLFSATIWASENKPGHDKSRGILLADEQDYFWDPSKPEQASLWHSEIVITEAFFNKIIESPVPLDLNAVREIQRSPLALDVYAWLTWRMFSLNKEVAIPYTVLQAQFGSEYSSLANFKVKFDEAVRKVLKVYPVNLTKVRGKLILKPSATSIPNYGRRKKEIE